MIGILLLSYCTTSQSHGRRLNQPAVYKQRLSGRCGDSAGEGKITSKAACEAGAAALGWGDTTARQHSWSYYPPGCVDVGGLVFNTANSNYACSSNFKCSCTLVCPPGTYQDQTGQSTCKECPSNTFSAAGASNCPYSATTCPTGTYASGTATVCDSCATGKYNDQTSQTSCKSCNAGEYQNEVGKASCKDCPAGTYANGTATVCDACATGKYNDQTSQTSESVACKSCGAGEYQNEVGKASCNNDCFSPLHLIAARCIDNTVYQERTSGICGDSGGEGNITSNAACGAGAAALGWGDTTATTGSYSGLPPGCSFYSGSLYFNTHFNTPGNRPCGVFGTKCICTLTCPPGTYQDQTGQSTCKECPSNTFSAAGASNCPYSATTCPTGTYASGTATVCDSCGTGKYNDQTSQTSCKNCDAGKYQNEVGKASCKDCPAGTYANGTATVCDSCGTGKYNDETSRTSESVACEDCNAGKGEYQNEVGKASCKDCVSPLVLTLDARCIDNAMYQQRLSGRCGDSAGEGKITSAAACGAGAAALGWGDTSAYTLSQSNFPPGCGDDGSLYFNTANTNIACSSNKKCICTLVCPPGTYQDQTGQSTCKECPSDTFSAVGATICTLDANTCPIGTYASGTATVCDSCGAGKYNDATNQTSCKNCDAGKYQNEVGKASCKDCPAGTYANGTATVCDSCATGKYNDQTSQTSCKSCNAGEYQNEVGKASCKDCPAGTYANGTATVCDSCGTGKYNDETSRTSESVACEDCNAGEYQNEEGKSSCKDCPAGTYANGTATVCDSCPSDTYSIAGASSCPFDATSCPAGTYASGTAACDSCPSGTYSIAGASSCPFDATSCPAGTYASGTAACDSCPSGTYSIAGASSCPFDATSCPAGTYANGNAACDSCGAGKYNDLTSQTSQTSCKDDCNAQGDYIKADKSACLSCPTGQYAIGTNTCTHPPECADSTGLVANSGVCKCGTTWCDEDSGYYCNQMLNSCSLHDNCVVTNGTVATDATCACGSVDCAVGEYCRFRTENWLSQWGQCSNSSEGQAC